MQISLKKKNEFKNRRYYDTCGKFKGVNKIVRFEFQLAICIQYYRNNNRR